MFKLAYRLGARVALQTFEKHADPLVGEAEKLLPRLLERLTGSARETIPTRLRGAAEAAEKRLGGLSSAENMFAETPQWAGPPKPGEAVRNFATESNPELAEAMRATRAGAEGDLSRAQENLQRHWGADVQGELDARIRNARLLAAGGIAGAGGLTAASIGAATDKGKRTYYTGPTLKDLLGR